MLQKNFYIFGKFFWFINYICFSVDIDIRADIDGGCILLHPIGIVIGDKVKIGRYVKIYQNVTIGGNFGKNRQKNGVVFTQPIIEGHAILLPGAQLFGPIILKKYVVVGACSVLTADLESNHLYIGKLIPIERTIVSKAINSFPK